MVCVYCEGHVLYCFSLCYVMIMIIYVLLMYVFAVCNMGMTGLHGSPNQLHLVVSVSDNMYLALPRGGINEWHVMIIPVECTSSRMQLSPGAEMSCL